MLHDGLIGHAATAPDSDAIVAADGQLSYGELDALANRIARSLLQRGVGPGDRVGIWMEKSTVAVATMHAALRLGAAYVPVDPMMPEARAGFILSDCQVRTVVTSSERLDRLARASFSPPSALCVGADEWQQVLAQNAEALPSSGEDPDRLAYILYPSGSTGKPKGVCISHANALAFVDWAVETAGLTHADRLSNHAPFHFDLSVFDLYGAFAAGACVVLLPDSHSFAPLKLVEALVEERISVWYSVPSVLILMVEAGGLLDHPALPNLPLRLIFFAGEPFPIQSLRPLRQALGHVRFLNLYGPTETNVCTAYEVHGIDPLRSTPVPIGSAASGDRVWAQTPDGNVAEVGEEGELFVEGPTVMLGYWGLPPHGKGPYATGDLVRRVDADNFEYLGRRDQMLKVRGHRIEAGEIEAALRAHPAIAHCAVITSGQGLAKRLVACLVCHEGYKRPGLLAIKAHLAARVPRYMIVDRLCFFEALPCNRNGKTDRRAIADLADRQMNTSEDIHANA